MYPFPRGVPETFGAQEWFPQSFRFSELPGHKGSKGDKGGDAGNAPLPTGTGRTGEPNL